MPPLNPCPPFNASILLVDDEPDVLEVLHLLLTSKMQGAIVDRADSGRAALERLAATDYDVVVSDVVMPGMSGLELLERIRSSRPDTPVVLMTGFSERDLIVRALRGGAYDFIEKPIDHDHFLATVTRAVQVCCLSSTVVEQKAALERHATELEQIVEERTQALRNEITERKRVEEELHSALDRLRAVIGSSPIAIASLDTQGRVTGWNQAAEHIFGWTEEEVLGRELPYLAPGQEQESEAIWEGVMRGGELGGLERRRLRKDGTPVDIAVWATRLFDQHGTVAGSMGLAIDVTERKRAEETLQQAHQKHQELVDTIDGLVWEADAQTFQFSYVSRKAERLLGYPIAQWLNEPTFWADHIHPDDRERTVAVCVNATKEMRSHTFECRMLAADGRTVWLQDIVTVVVENNQAVKLRGVMVDITGRKWAEEKFRRVVEAAPSAILLVNQKGTITLVNAQAERVFGYAREELLGQPVETLVPARFRGIHPGHRVAFFADPRIRDMGAVRDLYGLHKDGREIPIAIGLNPLETEEGLMVMSSIIDITERKRMEEERGDLYKRLQESHKGLRTLSQRLLEAQELERRRIARELHDETGQTLTSLLIGMRTLEEMPMRAAVRKRVSELRKTVAHVINEIKRLALGLHPSVLDDLGLETALRRLTEEFAQAHGLMVDLHMNGLDGNRLPLAVETILYRISQEALTNVAKHAGDARVSILLQCSPSAAKMIIEDDGRGFDVQAVLKPAGRSNHMGLHGMRERAASLNGSIEIESTPGGGTTIYVHVPLGRGGSA